MSIRLTEALRLGPGRIVAFTGAGGKSSSLETLAGESRGRAPFIASTTTRLGAGQTRLAQEHLPSPTLQALAATPITRDTSLLVSGGFDSRAEKWTAPEAGILEALRDIARQQGAILALEADGARQRLVKAPAAHEPVVPPWTDVVVPVVGLGAIGQPLGLDVAHRPERIAEVLGIQVGDVLTPEDLGRLLTSAEGALKGIPDTAEVRVLLTGDAEEEEVDEIAERVLGESRVRAVVHGQRPIRRAIGRVGGIVLAAGGGSRLGLAKPLVEWKGEPLLRHVLRAGRAGGLDPIVVVIGAEAASVREILDPSVVVVENPGWVEGQSTSVRLGLEAVEGRIEAAMFLLADMPRVSGRTIQALVRRHQQTLADAVAPVGAGRRGNPVLFDRRLFGDLARLKGDQGGRSLLEGRSWEAVEVDPAEFFDLDGPADLDSLRGMS